MKQLFSRDAATGITQWFHHDPVTDTSTIETVQDVAPIAGANHDDFKQVTSLDRWGDGQRVARIPLTVYHELRKKGITQDSAAFKRWLNDPDNRVFRTRPGRV